MFLTLTSFIVVVVYSELLVSLCQALNLPDRINRKEIYTETYTLGLLADQYLRHDSDLRSGHENLLMKHIYLLQ